MRHDTSNMSVVWTRFFDERTEQLRERFPGLYRAEVVETNDPLQIYRVRFKCPELHDSSLKPEECPWAIPAPWLGSKDAGSWMNPIIGDIIFVTWEKQHPYGPIWVGFAMGTRRKRYPLESIFTQSPVPVNAVGTKRSAPDEEWKPIEEYLAKDFRPMQNGWRDRYGNSEINNSVGFFPKEHDADPAPQDMDAVSKKQFTPTGQQPKVNQPDRKYLAKLTKYGIFTLSADVGYYWKKDDEDQFGEFKGIGDDEDEGGAEERQWEIDRYHLFVKLFNEDKPNSEDRDQRRFEIRTRAGHKFEMRDVGWAQKGGGLCGCEPVTDAKCRVEFGTYGTPRILSKWEKSDERWMKLRTKGGHVFQMMDMGFHPEEDEFYKRKLLEECGPDVDHEKSAKWISRDSRQIRWVTRWGIKVVLDDRGTDPKKADTEENPRGNGWMMKSRRSWQAAGGDPRGFAIECNDKDDLNTTRWYTPKSKLIEMNDRKDYSLMCTDMQTEISKPWKGLDENEFATAIGMTYTPEENTYHLKLDKRNGYIRLKTAAGGDNIRKSPEPENHSATCGLKDQNAEGSEMLDQSNGINQGVEMRDGDRCGSDGPWAEIVDFEDRGMWFTKNYEMGIWRAKQGKDQFIMIHDGKNTIVLRNNENGPLQIFCAKDIQLISGASIQLLAQDDISLKTLNGDIIFDSAKVISSRAEVTHNWSSGGDSAHAQLAAGSWLMDVPDNAPQHNGLLPGALAGGGAQSDAGGPCETFPGAEPAEIDQDPRKPSDRAEVCNDPFDEVDELVVIQCKGKDSNGQGGQK